MLEPYSHILWDWNGTLLDDTRLCLSIMNQLLVKYSLRKISLSRYREIFDFPVEGYYRRLGFDFSTLPFQQIGGEFITLYQNEWRACALHNLASQVLEKNRANHKLQFILSASDKQAVCVQIEHFRIKDFFTDVYGLDNHYAAGKIATGRKLIGNLQAPLHKVLLIGDTAHDYEVAQALGIDCLLVCHGHHSRRRLRSAGAQLIRDLRPLMS